jgi:hypothetical protein
MKRPEDALTRSKGVLVKFHKKQAKKSQVHVPRKLVDEDQHDY